MDNIIYLVLVCMLGLLEGIKGILFFIVLKFLDDGMCNVVIVIGLEYKLGIYGLLICIMDYVGVKGWLIGGENVGMCCMFMMMNFVCFNVGVQGVGIVECVY